MWKASLSLDQGDSAERALPKVTLIGLSPNCTLHNGTTRLAAATAALNSPPGAIPSCLVMCADTDSSSRYNMPWTRPCCCKTTFILEKFIVLLSWRMVSSSRESMAVRALQSSSTRTSGRTLSIVVVTSCWLSLEKCAVPTTYTSQAPGPSSCTTVVGSPSTPAEQSHTSC